jgi:hypothetical protein
MHNSGALRFVHMFQMVESHDFSFVRYSTTDPLQVRFLAKLDRPVKKADRPGASFRHAFMTR